MAPRNYAMEIAAAFAKADAQTLAEIGYELLASLGEARGALASFEAQKARDREYDRERKRRVRRNPVESVESDGIRGLSPFPPTPPFNPSTSPSSSSARATWKPNMEAEIAARLPTDHGRVTLAAVLAKCGNKAEVCLEIGMILDGGRPNVPRDPAVIELALADFAANEDRWVSALFRRYVQRAGRIDDDPPTNGNGNGARRRGPVTNPGAQQVANIMGGPPK